jgi:hypothetical protein
LVFVTLCASLVHAPSPYLEVCLAASVIMLGVSFVQYLRRFVQVIRSPREAPYGAS